MYVLDNSFRVKLAIQKMIIHIYKFYTKYKGIESKEESYGNHGRGEEN